MEVLKTTAFFPAQKRFGDPDKILNCAFFFFQILQKGAHDSSWVDMGPEKNINRPKKSNKKHGGLFDKV